MATMTTRASRSGLANELSNVPQNRQHTPSQRATNGLASKQWTDTPFAPIPQRAEVPCACGCGACFVPKNNQQKYLNDKHRYWRYMEDKRNATFAVIEALLWVYGRCGEEVAARRAHEAVDFYFDKWCKCLVKCGWTYDSKQKSWRKAL